MSSAAYDTETSTCNVNTCAGHPNTFCFFCAYEPHPTAGENDMPSQLRKLVHTMSANSCEVSHIARRLHEVYNENVKTSIAWEDPQTGEIVTGPEWGVESITRHLLHASEFALFGQVVERAFESILLNLNSRMYDEQGDHDPEVLRAFLDTTKTYVSFRKSAK